MSLSFYKHSEDGFTLVELMVSISIMITISALVLLNQTKYTEGIALNQVADEIGLNLRQAQIYGVAVKEFSAGSNNFSASYGIEFDITSRGSKAEYVSFGDRDPKNGIYDGAWSCPTGGTSECISKTNIRVGNEIEALCQILINGTEDCTVTRVAVTFVRPETSAGMKFYNTGGFNVTDVNYKGVHVKLKSLTGPERRSIKVYTTGQISVQ